jgi:hypothetical protein
LNLDYQLEPSKTKICLSTRVAPFSVINMGGGGIESHLSLIIDETETHVLWTTSMAHVLWRGESESVSSATKTCFAIISGAIVSKKQTWRYKMT